MKDSQETVCFTCGQPAGETPRLNCLPGGQVCPTCRDRLLECLPPCLPGEGTALEAFYAQKDEESADQDSDEDPTDPGSGPTLEMSRGPGQVLRGEECGDEPA